MIDDADLIVILGTQANLEPSRTPIEVWDTDEPSLGGIERVRLIRDDIAARVDGFVARISDPADPPPWQRQHVNESRRSQHLDYLAWLTSPVKPRDAIKHCAHRLI